MRSKQQRVPELRFTVLSIRTWMMVLTELHVPHGLPIAIILGNRHVGTAHAAFEAVRAARM